MDSEYWSKKSKTAAEQIKSEKKMNWVIYEGILFHLQGIWNDAKYIFAHLDTPTRST